MQTHVPIAAFVQSSFAQRAQQLTEQMKRILDAAELPSDPEAAYLVTTDRTWAPIENNVDLGTKLESARLPLNVAVSYCGYRPDSPDGRTGSSASASSRGGSPTRPWSS